MEKIIKIWNWIFKENRKSTRLEYWLWYLFNGFALYSTFNLMPDFTKFIMNEYGQNWEIFSVIFYGLIVVFWLYYSFVSLVRRRLKDTRWSEDWAFFIFVPYANIVFAIIVGLLPSSKREEIRK